MALTEQQRVILQDAQHNGGTITKKQVVESYGHCYFCNGAKHLGDILSNPNVFHEPERMNDEDIPF